MPLLSPYRLLLALSCLLLAQVSAWAQNKLLPDTRIFHAKEYYEEQGLISNTIYQISQEQDGLLWLLTNKGIVTFDGLNWHKHSEKLNLPNTVTSLLKPMGDAMVVLGEVAGEHKREVRFGIYRNRRWRFIPTPAPGNHSWKLHFALQEKQEELETAVIVSRTDVYFLQKDTQDWQLLSLPQDFKEDILINNIQLYQDKLWLSTTNGLYNLSLTTGKIQQVELPSSLSKNVLRVVPRANKLVVLGQDWIGKITDRGFQLLNSEGTAGNPNMFRSTLLVDKSENILFSRNHNLHYLNTEKLEKFSFRLNDATSVDAYSAIFQDKEGNYWFGSARGLKKLSSFGIANFSYTNGLPENEVSMLLPLSGERMLLAGDFSRAILDHKGIHTIGSQQNEQYVGDSRVLDACQTPDGSIYLAGNRKGLGELKDDNSISWTPIPDDLWAISVMPAPDSIGVWVGSGNGSLFLYQAGQGLRTIQHFNERYIRKLVTTASGRIFALTNRGAYELNRKGEILQHISGEGRWYNLYDLAEFNGQLILASTKGLATLNNGKLDPISLGIDRPVYALAKVGSALWLGTDNGIYAWGGGQIHHISLEDGLLGREINRGAFKLLNNGQFWIGTDKGLSVLDNQYFSLYAHQPITSLTQLKAGKSNWVHPTQAAAFAAHSSSLEFSFNSIYFYRPTSLQYRYRLRGLEDEWQYINNPHQSSVRYPHLPPGTYQFELQSRGYNTVWGKLIKSGQITVKQPFYFSPDFLIGLFLAIALLVYLIFSLILSKRNALKLEEAIENKRHEIATSEERFRRLWEAADMGMALVQANGQVLMSNSSLQQMLSSKHLNGKRINTLIPSTLLSETELQQVQSQSELKRKELSLTLYGTKRHFLLTLSPVFQVNQNCVLVMLKEVSELKRIQEENQTLTQQLLVQNHDLKQQEEGLRKSNEALLEQRAELQKTLEDLEERNFELDQLVYKTSHDLRAPISSTLGLLNIMKIENDPAATEHYIELAIQALNKQDAFIKSMLSFSRATRIQNPYLAVDFREVIQICLDELQFVPGFDTVNIEYDILHEHIPFVGDPQKLKIVFANLISNSIKYRDRQKQSALSIFISLNKQKADIRFIDNGIGIEPAYLPKVFDMFYRATADANGSGLGLYIVKQTIEKMEGTIAVQSEPGEGTEFTILLPNALSKEKKQGETSLDEETYPNKG